MKIVFSWLRDFVDLPKNVTAADVAGALGSMGIEVAAVTEIAVPQGVIVGRVVSREQHPNADKLSLCKVDDGSGGEPLQIVCGAPNVRADMIVALATVGTQIAPDFKISKAKIRGVESFGMLCSEKELGLSDSHEGIMSLHEDYKIGAPLSDYIPYDATLEIEITPNRGDCLSVLGAAREVAAKFGLPLKNTALRPTEKQGDEAASAITVTVEDTSRCPRYLGRLVRNVTVKPSPEWMRRRLTMAGLRPINNVVDITNYILLQYGQPMHAFDYAAIADRKIVVKTAQAVGVTEFTTLDGIVRKLAPDDLLICDGKRPVALAGVMGGAGSEITDATKDVFLECAFFEQGGVRKTSKRLGLSTDSSYRFERGVDPAQTLVDAIDTAAELLREYADGTVAAGIIDTRPNPFPDKVIALRPSRVNATLGVTIDADTMTKSLNLLQIKHLCESDDLILCTVPHYRHDIALEADLIEEVGRMYGYDNIPAVEKAYVDLVRPPTVVENNRDMARRALCYFGMNEIMTNSMVSEARRALLTPDVEPVAIMNPLNPDMAHLRTTMSGSLLEALAYNLNRKNRNNRLFEIGKIFRKGDDDFGLARETDILAIVIEGDCFPKSWNNESVSNGFFVLKGIIEAFAANCGMGEVVCARASAGGGGAVTCTALSGPLYADECATLTIGSNIGNDNRNDNRGGNSGNNRDDKNSGRDNVGVKISGSMGRVSDKICKAFGIKTAVYYAGMDITDWLSTPKPLPKYVPLPKFPALERDFSFVMPETQSAETVVKEICAVSDLIKRVRPFDVYKGDKLSAGTKSVTFSVEFRSPEKTLTDEDVLAACEKIVKVMGEKYGAELRT